MSVDGNSASTNTNSNTTITMINNPRIGSIALNPAIINTNLLRNNLCHSANTALLQEQLSVIAAQQQQQQLRTAFSRAVSAPQNSTPGVSLMNTLMENLANARNISNCNQLLAASTAAVTAATSNGHRNLERTQSEPLPQVNTSR